MAICALILCLVATTPHSYASSISLKEKVTVQAIEFMNLLSQQQQQQLVTPYVSAERLRWSNLPGSYRRAGLKVGDLADNQRMALHTLLQQVLSPAGYLKLLNIMRQDQAIKERYTEEANDLQHSYGHALYHIAFFGQPSATEPWMLKFEGHHFSLNLAFSQQGIQVTPLFMGAHPAKVQQGTLAGSSHMAQEETDSWRLFNSLTDEQRKKTILTEKMPDDITVRRGDEPVLQATGGLPVTDMNPRQQYWLKNVIRAWLHNLPAELARQKEEKMMRHLGNTTFAWAGGVQPGQARYFRIASPAFIIELDNRSYEPNHIHSVWWELPAAEWNRNEE